MNGVQKAIERVNRESRRLQKICDALPDTSRATSEERAVIWRTLDAQMINDALDCSHDLSAMARRLKLLGLPELDEAADRMGLQIQRVTEMFAVIMAERTVDMTS